MDINNTYKTIIEKLRVSNNLDVIAELENCSAGAATGSEALMATGFYLLNLKHNYPLSSKIIKEQIEEYLTYCKQNGLIIK